MNDYASRVLQGLTARNPNQPEFLQAATEMLCSLTPVLERHPEFEQAGLLERFVEPERTIAFRIAWVDDHGITLEQVAPHKPIHIRVEPGARCELYNTAPGKLFLGWMSEADAQAYLRHTPIVKHTPQTLDRHALLAQIAAIRKQGYAVDRGEALEGSHCIAAPIIDRNGACIGALTVTGFSAAIGEKQFPKIAAALIASAGRISQRLD